MKQSLVFMGLVAVLVGCAPSPARGDIGVGVVFSDNEIRIIEAWYRDADARPKPAGGGKSRGLPPGIAKNLVRGKALPPGIAKQQLPDGLRRALPAPPAGYERVVVDGRILLVEIATQLIHDVLVDAVFR